MSDRQDPRLEAAVREVLGASARRLPPSAPPVAAVLRAGQRRQRARRAVAGAAVAAVVAALCATVPLLRPDATGPVATPVPTVPAHRSPPPSPSATGSAAATPSGPRVFPLASGTLDGTDWRALARVDGPNFCLRMTIGTAVVDAPAGYWNNCLPLAMSTPSESVAVHVAHGGPLRLVTAFGSDVLARVVVTFVDGTTRRADAVRLPGSTTMGAVLPVAPGQVISVIDLYDPHGVRVDHETGYR